MFPFGNYGESGHPPCLEAIGDAASITNTPWLLGIDLTSRKGKTDDISG
jgi:hypothetical protein